VSRRKIKNPALAWIGRGTLLLHISLGLAVADSWICGAVSLLEMWWYLWPGSSDRSNWRKISGSARVSEALNVHLRELRLDRARQVSLYGKGRKERLCPLWPETAEALRRIVIADSEHEPAFQNARGGPLSCNGVAYLVGKYARRASESMPHLSTLRITPHVMRHRYGRPLLCVRHWSSAPAT
jgi:integrase